MSASLLPKQKEQESLIIHISRPVRSFIKRFSVILLIILSLFITFINHNDHVISRSLRAHTQDLFAPVLSVVSAPFKGINNLNVKIRNIFLTHQDNIRLREKTQRLEKKLLHFEQLLHENKRLKALLNYTETLNYKPITAKVIGTTVDPFIHSILISAGSDENVQKGQAVITHEGLVGRVSEVTKHTARVLLLSDINSRIPVISSISREHAILAGKNTPTPQLRYLDHETHVQQGEQLLTSGEGSVFPSGIPVGVIIDTSPAFTVHPFVTLHRLEMVSILQYAAPQSTPIITQ